MNSKKDKRKEIHRHMIVKISKTEDKKKKSWKPQEQNDWSVPRELQQNNR